MTSPIPTAKERPILLKVREVRGILENRQTQLRRTCKEVGAQFWLQDKRLNDSLRTEAKNAILTNCPYGQPGDRLWGRETFAHLAPEFDYTLSSTHPLHPGGIWYAADEREAEALWQSSSQMPRDLSRILLEVVSVRVERVQDISQDDAKASGFLDGGCLSCGESSYPVTCGCADPRPDHVDAFVWRWHQDHGENGPNCWIANPWVWVVEFKRVTA
jgi:hypothetical protein